MSAFSRTPCTHDAMLSFFRRKKPDTPATDKPAQGADQLAGDVAHEIANESASTEPAAVEPVPAEIIAAAMEIEPEVAAAIAEAPAAPGKNVGLNPNVTLLFRML